jgi:hypothetical protein
MYNVKQTMFVFLFRQGTDQPHQGDVNTREAIPNTTKRGRYQIARPGDPNISFFHTWRQWRWVDILFLSYGRGALEG